MTPKNRNTPGWAQRQRQADFSWIAENLDAFWIAATIAFNDTGRGVIFVDVTIQPTPSVGHPFGYFSQELIEQQVNRTPGVWSPSTTRSTNSW